MSTTDSTPDPTAGECRCQPGERSHAPGSVGWCNRPATPPAPAASTPASDGLTAINVVFDGPPSHESGRFVEVETDDGKSIRVGKWIERDDGMWALRIDFADRVADAEAKARAEMESLKSQLGEQADIEREAFGRGVAWAMSHDAIAAIRGDA